MKTTPNIKKIGLDITSPSLNLDVSKENLKVNVGKSKFNPTIEINNPAMNIETKTATIHEKNHKNLKNLDFENSGHTGFQPAGDYALKSDIPDTNYFVTKDEVPKKLSELENDSNFVDKEYVDNEIKNIDVSGIDLSNYYDKEEIDAKFQEIPETDLSNYYNKEEVDNKFDNIDIPDVDLSDYYNKSEIDEKFENIDIPDVDLSNYYNKDEINGLANELIGMVPEIIPLEEFNPETQYNDNQITNANALGYLVREFSTAFDETYQYIEDVKNEAVKIIPTKTSQLENDANFVNSMTLGQMMTSRPTYNEIQPIIDYRIGLALDPLYSRFLPESATEGSVLKYINGQWVAVPETTIEDSLFIVNYTLNPQTMEITNISHYSADIKQAYNKDKNVIFRGYVLGLNVYVNSEIRLIEGNMVYTQPVLNANLGQGELNYLFKVGIGTSTTNVSVHVLQEVTNNVVENPTIEQIEELNVSSFEEKTVKEVEE